MKLQATEIYRTDRELENLESMYKKVESGEAKLYLNIYDGYENDLESMFEQGMYDFEVVSDDKEFNKELAKALDECTELCCSPYFCKENTIIVNKIIEEQEKEFINNEVAMGDMECSKAIEIVKDGMKR